MLPILELLAHGYTGLSKIFLYTTEAIETAKAVHIEHSPNIAHFDGPTTTGSGHTAYEHVCSICLRLIALATLPCQGNIMKYGFIRASVYFRL